jgi:hypothetical protein
MKIRERSENAERVQSNQGDSAVAGPGGVEELRSARGTQPSSPRHFGRQAGDPGHTHPFRAVRAAVFP